MAYHQELSENLSRDELEKNLIESCLEGDEGQVEILLSQGVFADAGDEYGFLPLMHACMNENEKIVHMLLDHGAKINASNDFGYTALLFACESQRENIVKLLIEHGADVNWRAHNNLTPLIMVCRFGNLKIVEMLVESGADINVGKRTTALEAACFGSYYEVAEFLMDHGADGNFLPDDDESDELNYYYFSMRSGLWAACRAGSYKIVSLMLKRGVDSKKYDGKFGLLEACRHGHEEVVTIMIESGTDVNFMNEMGETSLSVACLTGREGIIKLLVKNGADINLCSKTGTALMNACAHEKIVEYLLEQGADVSLTAENGKTALIEAIMRRSVKSVAMLITCGADVNASYEDGKTPLMMACLRTFEGGPFLGYGENYALEHQFKKVCGIEFYENSDILELLLQHGAEIDAKHECGLTASMMTVVSSRENYLEILLAHTPILDLTDNKGWTVFSLAMVRSNKECLRLLLRNGYLQTEGRLKSVYQIKRKDRICSEPLQVTMEFGIFDWAWCHVQNLKPVSLEAMKSGLCPGKIRCDHSGCSFSPLIMSFIFDDKELQEILKQLYFFPEDYVTLTTDKKIREYRTYTVRDDFGHGKIIECRIVTDSLISDELTRPVDFTLADEFTLQPLTLRSWSFLHISKYVSLAGLPSKRGQRVDSLPIPDKFKKLLKFEMVE